MATSRMGALSIGALLGNLVLSGLVIVLSAHINDLKYESAMLKAQLAVMQHRAEAHRFGDRNPEPLELTNDQKARGIFIYYPIKPMDIELRIVPREKWDRTDLAAYTTPWSHPCRIYIPEGWGTSLTPARGEAHWLKRDDGDTLAHEILHCERGRWHPPWGQISDR